jgi:glycosyltransferase involved in cell wall biosynthesis
MLFRKEKKKERVVFLTKAYKWGGTEKHLEELIVRLDYSRVEPVILCFGRDVYTDNIKKKRGLELEIRNGAQKSSFFAYWLSIVKTRPDIIVFVNGILGAFPWQAYVAARCTLTRKIFAIEQLIAEPAPLRNTGKGFLNTLRRLIGWTARCMLKHKIQAVVCDRIIGVSKAVCQRLINEYEFPDRKLVTIWNGVDLKYFGLFSNGKRSLNGDSHGESSRHNLLCVARLSPEKNLDLLLEAMCKVLIEQPSTQCTIIGDGPLKTALIARACTLGICASVHFTGHVEEVRPYYEAADVFVLSSSKEGLPLSISEAMAFGLPCIATDVGGNAEIIAHGETGLIVDPGNSDQLARAILYLLQNAELRHQMGQNGKLRVQQYFDINRNMARICEVILNDSGA